MSGRSFRNRLPWIVFGGFLWLATIPTVSAVQPHEQPEGYIVHQLAHVAFLLTMGYVLWRLNQNDLFSATGWRDIAIGAGLFGLWNAITIVVHHLVFTREMAWVGDTSLMVARTVDIATFTEWVVYLGQMDYVVAVAGIAMLYRGFRRLEPTDDPSEVDIR